MTERVVRHGPRRIKDAPLNCVMVVADHTMVREKQVLVREYGRGDIRVVGPGWIAEQAWRGISRPVILHNSVRGASADFRAKCQEAVNASLMPPPPPPAEITREQRLESALRDMLRWFGSYPEMVPNPDRHADTETAIANARLLVS